jgi:uncharacterized delta-60 repeat protein
MKNIKKILALLAGLVFICNTALAANTSSTTSLGISNVAPTISSVTDNGSSGTTPTNIGTDVTFTMSASDPNGDPIYIAICKENSITANANAAPTCGGAGAWYVDTTERANPISSASVTTSTTGLLGESYDWYAFACDKVASGPLCSSMLNTDSPFKVNHRPVIGTVTAGSSYGSNNSVDPGSPVVTPFKFSTYWGTATTTTITSSAIQSDGKIVGVGMVNGYDFGVVRYNTDGSLDTTGFGSPNGYVTTDFGGYDMPFAVAIQSNGKIVVGGTSNGNFALARYNTDGTLDSSFGSGGKVTTAVGINYDASINSIAIQSADQKIVAAGNAELSGSNSNTHFALARYTTTGGLDGTFGSGGIVNTVMADANTHADTAQSVAIQSNGEIVAGGYAYRGVTTGYDFAVARYSSGGVLDNGFGSGGKAYTSFANSGYGDDDGWTLAIQPSDQKIVVAGEVGTPANSNYTLFGLARFTTGGVLDSTFGTGGQVSTDFGDHNDVLRSIALQSDGSIVAAGDVNDNSASSDFVLARYTTNGGLDGTFGTGGKVTTDFHAKDDGAYCVNIQTDGKIVATGFDSYATNKEEFALTRYTTAGVLDSITSGSGGTIYVQAGVTDTDVDTTPDTISMYVCSTDSFVSGACAATTLCSASGVASGANAQCSINGLVPIPTMHGHYPIYIFLKDSHGFMDAGTSNTQYYDVTNTPPYITQSTDYSTSAITLTAGVSTPKTYTVTVKDDNGDTDITGTTAVLYDSNGHNLTAGTCAASDNWCVHADATCTLSNNTSGTDNTATATCQFTPWYDADYSSGWKMHANPADSSGAVTNQTDSDAIATNALAAINIEQTAIAYGTIVLGGTSDAQPTRLQNYGNQVIDALIYGTDMARAGGGASIPAGQQKWYRDNTLDWDTTGHALQTSASAGNEANGCSNRNLAVRAAHDTSSDQAEDQTLYWKLRIPASQTAGSYSGTDTFASTAGNTCSGTD